MTTISLTEAAANRINSLVAKENGKAQGLRITVEGGGCSGFQYKYDMTEEIKSDDLVVEKNGAKLIIDSMSLELMQDSSIDFIDNLTESRFDIKNPNSSSNCGCGNSFNV
ncbi:MAG: iron-sulfur cluster insertion protein ErpA [Alphaproteobacteria bacterium]|nr:iron-sulfur cluster insertion protein ErpA [Alphaproteobacteria bacterium]OJV14246.1 MAG: heme biosynthesis protein HemY [Alphaproteobacteria bacterium 33-17]